MRYPGQAYEIQVPLASPATDPALRLGEAVAAFHDRHMTQYAHAERHVTPEIVAIRLAATGKLAKPEERPFAFARTTTPKGRRRVFSGGAWHEAAVLDRDAIGGDLHLQGPLIIDEAHATHFIPPGWDLTAAPSGDLVATRSAGTKS